VEFSELISRRRSIRSYRPDPVEDEKLQAVLSAACQAPTAANRQPFGLVVVHTMPYQEELRRLYDRDWFLQAPLLVCACGIPGQAWVHRSGKCYLDVDVAIVMDHLILAATNLGLGTCWIAAFDPQAARQIFSLPSQVEPIVLTPLGYPTSEPPPKERKRLSDLVHYDRW
jgi:nitroreductase